MARWQGEGDAYLNFWPSLSFRMPGSLAGRLLSFSSHRELLSHRQEPSWGFSHSGWRKLLDPWSTQLFASLPLEAGSCLQAAFPNQDQGLARAPDGPASCATPSGWLNGEREGLRWAKALGCESPPLLGLMGRVEWLPAGPCPFSWL